MREKIVAGNWKMNKSFEEAQDLVSNILEIKDQHGKLKNTSVVLIPPFVYLELVKDMTAETGIFTGAQNLSERENGAFTGEISASMLESMNIDFCLAGHSERRKYFGETDEMIAIKIVAALRHDISPIFCCGELLSDREKGTHFDIVHSQLNQSVFSLNPNDFANIVIAYEPVWAIGTGVNATSGQAQEMHAFIRELVTKKYGKNIADTTTILYGGSCNSKNAADLFAMPDVDGGLIGGASLDAEEFTLIVKAADALK
ncbi:MAG: triose-phosphate isomerase [Bacteroidales bacterium]|nr:triose-phosphate isomerase [Bacteroidales bacterium]